MAFPDKTREGMALDDFIRQYAEAPFELINGERIALVPPLVRHGLIIKQLYMLLLAYEQQHTTVEVFSELPFVLVYSSNWVTGSRTPDIMVYQAARLAAYREETPDFRDKPFVIVPDLVVEVISENDRYQDVDDKVDGYLADGVQLVWVVNPRSRTTAVYTPDGDRFARLSENGILDGGDLLPGFSIPVKTIFS